MYLYINAKTEEKKCKFQKQLKFIYKQNVPIPYNVESSDMLKIGVVKMVFNDEEMIAL